MKKINKPLSFVLALMTCLCLTGCGEDPDVDDTPSTPAKSVTGSVDTPSAPENSEPVAATPAEIVLEPVVSEITDITKDPAAGYGFHQKTVYGNAFGIINSYGSADGNIINNAPISIIPMEMKSLDDILATGYCDSIRKENLVETDFGGGTIGWTYTQEAAEKQAKNCGDYSFDELFEEMMIIELTASGVPQKDAVAQAKAKLAEAGLIDER